MLFSVIVLTWQQDLFVSKEQTKAAHQQGEKRDTQTCAVRNTGFQIRTHV